MGIRWNVFKFLATLEERFDQRKKEKGIVMNKRLYEYFHSTDCLKFYHTGSNNILSLKKKIGNKKEKKSLEQRKKELSYPSLPFFLSLVEQPPPLSTSGWSNLSPGHQFPMAGISGQFQIFVTRNVKTLNVPLKLSRAARFSSNHCLFFKNWI